MSRLRSEQGREPHERPPSWLFPSARALETTEEPVTFVVRSRREVEFVWVAGRTAASEQHLPEAVERERVAGSILEKTLRVTRAAVDRHDVPAPEVPTQQRAPDPPEAPRGERHSPGRVEDGQPAARRRARGEAPEETTLGVENVDEAVAVAFDVVLAIRVLHGEGHVEAAVDVVDAEGREARGGLRVREGARERGRTEVLVEDVHRAGVEGRCGGDSARRVAPRGDSP